MASGGSFCSECISRLLRTERFCYMGVTLQNHLSLTTREKLIQLLSYYTYKTMKYIGLPIFLCVMKSLSEAPMYGKITE